MGKRTKKLLSKLRKKPARRLSSTTDDSPSPKPKALKRTKVGREEVQPNPLDKLWQSSSTLSTEDGVVVKCPARFTNLFKAEGECLLFYLFQGVAVVVAKSEAGLSFAH
jgi:hypothetical protein